VFWGFLLISAFIFVLRRKYNVAAYDGVIVFFYFSRVNDVFYLSFSDILLRTY